MDEPTRPPEARFDAPPPGSAPPPPEEPPRFAAPPYAGRTFDPAPPPRGPGFAWPAFLGGTLFGCGCLSWLIPVLVIATLASAFSGPSTQPRREAVGLINVDGIITSGSPDGGLFGGSGAQAQKIIDQLKDARESDRIRGVVLYINSPGGSAAGSDAIYNEVRKLREAGKPVVAAMGDVAASGGYYVAAAADRIYANGATLTGSIGVITEIPNFSDPNGWINRSGYDIEVFKSGKYKDMGNPFRPIPAEERALFQQMVDDIYGQFLTAVSKGRNIPVETLRPMADGRVFTGQQAVRRKLVDQIGTLQDAIRYTNQKVGLKPDAEPYKFRDNTLSELLGGPGMSSRGLLGGAASPYETILLDPRVQAMAKGLASATGE